MSEASEDRLLDILDELCHTPPELRKARLDQLSMSDEDRRQVERWLSFDGKDGRFLDARPALLQAGMTILNPDFAVDTSPGDPASPQHLAQILIASPRPPSTASPPPAVVVGYEIREMLGEGGMATVWRALQVSTGRAVALKVMRPLSFASPRDRLRFDREVQLTARLEHPNIARVYDRGFSDGYYYYAMELVDGVPLDRHVSDRRLSRRQIVALMLAVCRAVAHAHQRGVIHRDLKPGNVLVDRSGQPRVLDFGLAKAIDEVSPESTLSLGWEVTGTPAYMSPEQAAGRGGARVDTRSDVYSLGVVLYRLVVGRSPFAEGSGADATSLQRVGGRRIIRRPRDVDRSIDADLEAVLLKSLAEDPDERYATAAELARDLDDYLAGRPVTAKAPSLGYVIRKAIQRNWRAASLVATTVVLLLTTTVFAFVRIDRARADALTAQGKAQRQAVLAEERRREAELRSAESLLAEGHALGHGKYWLDAVDRYEQSKAILGNLRASTGAADLSLAVAARYSRPALLRLGNDLRTTAISPDNRLIAAAGLDADVLLFDAATGRRLRTLHGHGGVVDTLAFLPDGERLLSRGQDRSLKLWDVETGDCLRTFRDSLAAGGRIAISPSGRFAAVPGPVVLKLWDLQTGRRLWSFTVASHEGSEGGIFSAAEDQLLVGREDGAIVWFDVTTGRSSRLEKVSDAPVLLATGDRGRIVCAHGRALELRDEATGRLLAKLGEHRSRINWVRTAEDGRVAVSAASDAAVVFRDVPSGQVLRTVWGTDLDNRPSISGDGRLAVSTREFHRAVVYDTGADEWGIHSLTGHRNIVDSVAISTDGRIAASGDRDSLLQLWDVSTGMPLTTLQGTWRDVNCLAFSRAGEVLVAGYDGGDGAVTVWDLASGSPSCTLVHGAPVIAIDMSADGTLVAAGSRTRVSLWDWRTRRRILDRSDVNGVAEDGIFFSADGRSVIAVQADGRAKRWDAGTGLPVPTSSERQPAGYWMLGGLAYLPARQTFLCFGPRTAWRLGEFDLLGGGPTRPFHSIAMGRTYCLAASADGRVAASSGDEGIVRLWDVASGREAMRLDAGGTPLRRLRLSPDGSTLIAADEDHVIRLVDLSTYAAARRVLPDVEQAQEALRVRPDDPAALAVLGQWLAVRGFDDRATDLMERAASGGAHVPPLVRARSYWRRGNLALAEREFRRAAELAEDPAERLYVQLCLRSLARRDVGTSGGSRGRIRSDALPRPSDEAKKNVPRERPMT